MADPDKPTPPDGVPRDLAAALENLSPEELRNAIVHAQELLQYYTGSEQQIEPGPGEDILRLTEHETYTEVVKQVSCTAGCSDCPHGPYLYHVTEESRPGGGERTHWTLIGRVADPEGN